MDTGIDQTPHAVLPRAGRAALTGTGARRTRTGGYGRVRHGGDRTGRGADWPSRGAGWPGRGENRDRTESTRPAAGTDQHRERAAVDPVGASTPPPARSGRRWADRPASSPGPAHAPWWRSPWLSFPLGSAALLAAVVLADRGDSVLFLAYLLIPWTAVRVVDSQLRRSRGRYRTVLGPSGGSRPNYLRAAIACCCGLAVELPSTVERLPIGPDPDTAWVFGLIVSAACYYILMLPVLRAQALPDAAVPGKAGPS